MAEITILDYGNAQEDQGSLDGINRLLAMLSGKAKPMKLDEMYRMIKSETWTFLAWVDGKIVGMASMAVVCQPIGIVCHVEDVVVDEEYRGQGISKELMLALIAMLPEGWRQLDLTSNPNRAAAHGLYEKLGFKLRETGNYRLSPAK